jgi:hypothetical protein
MFRLSEVIDPVGFTFSLRLPVMHGSALFPWILRIFLGKSAPSAASVLALSPGLLLLILGRVITADGDIEFVDLQALALEFGAKLGQITF